VGFFFEKNEEEYRFMNPTMKCYISVLATLLFLSVNSSDSAGENRLIYPLLLNNFIESSLPSNAKWSFSAVDLDTGRNLVDTGNSKSSPLVPGSLIKLFLTAAILDLGAKEDLELVTVFSYDGMISEGKLLGNLYVKGSGNAFMSETDLRRAAEALFSKNINEISGDVVIDDYMFDIRDWENGYHGPAYSAPAAFGLDMHTVSIRASGNPASVKISPLNDTVKIIFVPGLTPAIKQADDLSYEISGNISDSETVKHRFPLKDPALFAGLTFKTILKEKGVALKGRVRKGVTPADVSEVHKIGSKRLTDMVRDINTNSLNVAADNFLLLLGAKRFGEPGTREKGARAIEMFLEELGISGAGLSVADGSGLSPDNRITAGQLVEFLSKVPAKPWFSDFYASFSRAGFDGTLKNTKHKHERIRAKTGQLRDAFCLAGYVEKGRSNKVAFAYMVNVPGAELLWGREEDLLNFLERITDEKL
jgi:D-alanyl-D-alanine carboxypeptidase/D-alanyl-D-alanine-endopeptidase (penicillin-binding protein 4)